MMFIFGACGGKTKSYIRTWIEQQESVLILKDDAPVNIRMEVMTKQKKEHGRFKISKLL